MSGLLAGALPQSPSLSDKLCPSLEHRTICLGLGVAGKRVTFRGAAWRRGRGDGEPKMGGLVSGSFGGVCEKKFFLGWWSCLGLRWELVRGLFKWWL